MFFYLHLKKFGGGVVPVEPVPVPVEPVPVPVEPVPVKVPGTEVILHVFQPNVSTQKRYRMSQNVMK